MTLEQTKTYYRVGGSLPPDAPSYVRREADEQLYQKLKSGEFCYVLNSRQMGKSSLWVRVKQRLEQEDYICAAIDLSGIGQGDKKQWYTSFANRLTKSFDPSVKKQWRSWRKEAEHQELSPMEKLHQLIEELLLPFLLPHQKLVIFIDEIDYVKGLSFSTDEFFALIRSCYNNRSLNPQFNRVTFCLLGVATPADLIANKQLTPFNIGTGVELRGFREDEAEPLIAGLKGKVTSPESVMSNILYWTGGQPFLTQRLCSLVLAENNPTPDISQLVERQIIDNWETQDEQEHLRTIQNRILSNEQRAGYLLELYRQVLQRGQVPLNNSSEERELQLSGLVVKRNNALEVYNPIYARVFDEAWLDLELAKLRPYAENYRAWLQSAKTDVSRLLRGQALKDAETWASGKNLGGEDRDFLGASRAKEREEEIIHKEKEAELERERKAKEVAEAANHLAQRKIRIGNIILSIALIGAGISAVWGSIKFREALKFQDQAQGFIQQKQQAENKFREVSAQLDKANKNLEISAQKVEQAQEQEIKAKIKALKQEKQEQLARERAEQAQKDLKQAKIERVSLMQEVQTVERKVEEAQKLVQKANKELIEVQLAKAETDQSLRAVRELSVLAGELRKNGDIKESEEALRKAGLSTLIKDEKLKQTFLLAATAEVYKSLGGSTQAKEILDKLNFDSLDNGSQLEPSILNQVKAFAYLQAGKIKEKKYYQNAYNALKASNFDPFNPNFETDVLNEQDVENIHYQLIKSQNININSKTASIAKSFRKHLYAGLEFLLRKGRLEEADHKTYEIMNYIADTQEREFLTMESIENFDCDVLKKINNRWVDHPNPKKGHFGFSAQKEIWEKNGSPTNRSPGSEWRKFYNDLGWQTEQKEVDSLLNFQLNWDDVYKWKGSLPYLSGNAWDGVERRLFVRIASCDL